MQVKEIKKDGLSHEMEVTIPANDIDKRVDEKLKEVGKTIRMPGFRPGKVPMNILKQKYGKMVLGEVLEGAVNETSQKALNDKKLKPALQPKIEVKSFDEGKDLVYSMTVEVMPEFKIADYKGLKLQRMVAKPDDKAVNEALENIAASNKSSKPIEGARASKKGDIVVIDFHGRTVDDNKEHPGMHAHGHQLELGSGQFIEGFEDQLTGKKVGEKVEVKVTFPEAYGAPELAGRDAIFDVDLQEIREVTEAKVDDEFAKSLGLDDVKALKNAVSEQLGKELEGHTRLRLKKELMDKLDAAHDFEVPAGMLHMEYNNIVRQVEMEHQQAGGKGSLSDEEKAELKEIAGRRVRLGLILAEIGNQNNIQVSDPELQKAVISEAQKYPGQEREVFDYYSKNRQALESLRAPVFEEKVVDFILELAEITDKEVTAEELTAGDDEVPVKEKKPAAKKAAAKKDDGDADKPAKKPAAKKKAAKK